MIKSETPATGPATVGGIWRRLAAELGGASRLESACMVLGLGGMALALVLTLAQMTLAPVVRTQEALRRMVVEAGYDASMCPDGWAGDHAAMLDLTEAEVTAWYLSEAVNLSDADVIAAVGHYIGNAGDFRQVGGVALTRNQILLCIAESRRLATPLHELVPPELRRGHLEARAARDAAPGLARRSGTVLSAS